MMPYALDFAELRNFDGDKVARCAAFFKLIFGADSVGMTGSTF